MGKSVDLPEYATPDPEEIMNMEVEYNRYDTTNPYGTTAWTRDPESRKFHQEVTLAPEYEQLRQQQFNRQAKGLVKNPFSALAEASPGMGRIMAGAAQRVGERYDAEPGAKPPTFQPEPLPPIPEQPPQPNGVVGPQRPPQGDGYGVGNPSLGYGTGRYANGG